MNILITGEHGYIASHLKRALLADGHNCTAISLREGLTVIKDISQYDTVIHCAGMVHSKEKDPERYYRINTDLTAKLAERAKNSGVRHFIFMSSMAVYGVSDSLRGLAVIGRQTPENPMTPYGKSKLLAENKLRDIANDHFTVYILRLPMVYGEGAPGNYTRLRHLVRITPVFPKVLNKRSMLSIDNLQNIVLTLLKNAEQEEIESIEYTHILCPQDPELVCTSDLAASIAAEQGKTLVLSPFLGRLVLLFPIGPVRKMFGSLIYSEESIIQKEKRCEV